MSAKLFRRTIENLITNAVQTMDDKGALIEIVIKLENSSILITIRDNGTDLTEAVKEILFEPFSFNRIARTGLGLFITSYTINDIHKRKI